MFFVTFFVVDWLLWPLFWKTSNKSSPRPCPPTINSVSLSVHAIQHNKQRNELRVQINKKLTFLLFFKYNAINSCNKTWQVTSSALNLWYFSVVVLTELSWTSQLVWKRKYFCMNTCMKYNLRGKTLKWIMSPDWSASLPGQCEGGAKW